MNRAIVNITFGRDRWWPRRLALANRKYRFIDVCILPMMTGDRKTFVLEARRALSL